MFHEDIYAEYPQVEDLIDPLTERLDNETMAALNERVDVHGEEPAEVAWNFLVDEGFITEE